MHRYISEFDSIRKAKDKAEHDAKIIEKMNEFTKEPLMKVATRANHINVLSKEMSK